MAGHEGVILSECCKSISHACTTLGEPMRSDGDLRGDDLPLYCIVSKLRPTRFGSRKVFLVKSHVPSPTVMVFES